MIYPGESEQRARKRFDKKQQMEQARKAARAPWYPLEWAIPPMVIDFLPIWYEKRSGKIMLPDNMDRSFHWKFAAQFFAYSVIFQRIHLSLSTFIDHLSQVLLISLFSDLSGNTSEGAIR